MQGGDNDLENASPGVWTDECPEWPKKRFAIFELPAVLTAYFTSNCLDMKSKHFLMLWRGANKARENNASTYKGGDGQRIRPKRNQSKKNAPKSHK